MYYEILLLNHVGWFVLMSLAPLGWILTARRRSWDYRKKGAVSVPVLLPSPAAIGFSLVLNGALTAPGLQ